MNDRLFAVLRAPRVSEKTARMQETNQYVFEIGQSATKADVKAAVEQLFHVEVEAVNVLSIKGKARAFRSVKGMRSSKRKAYVRLREGQTIDVMAKA